MKFLGAWLVTEYVYNPNGRFIGIVRQRRELEEVGNGRLRVTQHCEPEAALRDHAMGAFAGRHVFELSVDGRYRHYHGTAVMGSGRLWGDNVVTGRGLWPQFGHNFRSLSILPQPHWQLTSGKFFNATEMMANIVGVGVNENNSRDWPKLDGPHWAGDIATQWQGTMQQVRRDGFVERETPLHRRYGQHLADQLNWADHWDDRVNFALDLHPNTTRLQINGVGEPGVVLHGVGKQFGWLLEIEAISDPGVTLVMTEVLDGRSGHLVGLRRWLRENELERIEVIQLRPM